MKQFKLYNSLFGWLVFAIAAFTYISTCEPTASLWDCGEFIATSYKFEVGHPPGNPMFMVLARFFSLFAGSNVELVARMVNYMSALMSAFTILFLFWSISHIIRKIIVKNNEFNNAVIAIIIGSGIVGSLAYTFSDTFWFSAVEGEVYASSSLFTALVFWAILKWEEVADEPYANRWIILIAFLMGLSIGVHLLNLLAIPSIVMVYYFRKFKINLKGALLALLLSIVILGFAMYGIVQGLVQVTAWVELLFVNKLALQFNSGVIIFLFLVLVLLVFLTYLSVKKHKLILNTVCLGTLMLLLGYSSYAIIVIRASADPPVNENQPDNIFSLVSYINREQYGDRPLIWGPYYNTPFVEYTETKNIYLPGDKDYKVVGKDYKAIFNSEFCTFFPRMYSTDANHIDVYKSWAKIRGKSIDFEENGKVQKIYLPTFVENLRFFLKYQVGHMYMRYFLWNFVGRQNDEQSTGGITKGNWLSGINFLDYFQVGPQNKVPESIKFSESRNVYYGLPLLLGILGLLFLIDKSKRYFIVTTLLFIMTGLAIVVWLNQTPMQPRERDYAYAGSFYAFSIWIGVGVAMIWDSFKKLKGSILAALLITAICLLVVPALMAKENWKDHDRSGRYTTKAYAYNYLNSCAPNAILFTYGDNDTFPLWYLQEVEGIRTDVRVVNLMLLNMDWYFNQLKKKAYNSDPLPISLSKDKYEGDKRNWVYLVDKVKENIDLKKAIDFVASDDPETKKIETYNNLDFVPGRNFYIPVNKQLVLANGTVTKNDSDKIVNEITFTIKGSGFSKNLLGFCDILAYNNWKRPIYFTSNSEDGSSNLKSYLQNEGFVYRLVPIKSECNSEQVCGNTNTDITYNNLINKCYYGHINDPDVYIDYFNRRTLEQLSFRTVFSNLAKALIHENKKDSALSVLDKCESLVPARILPYDIDELGIIESYFEAGDSKKGSAILKSYFKTCTKELDYYLSLPKNFRNLVVYDTNYEMEALRQMKEIAEKYKQNILTDIEERLSNFQQKR